MMTPSIGRIVHYVSFGSAGGEYGKRCRAAIVTEVSDADPQHVGLAVVNPTTGLFFQPLSDGGCHFHDGAATQGAEFCTSSEAHGNPLRYCACGWIEAGYLGGTWHWPERIES